MYRHNKYSAHTMDGEEEETGEDEEVTFSSIPSNDNKDQF